MIDDIMNPPVWGFAVQHRFVDFSGDERSREPPSDVDLAVSAAGKKAGWATRRKPSPRRG